MPLKPVAELLADAHRHGYASLAQLDTWGRAGCPVLEYDAIRWNGIDGTTIPSIPKNALFGYRHALMPHDETLTNADRLEASAAFCQPLLARVGPLQTGELPASKGFVTVTPASVQLSALLKKPGGKMELRVVEVEGKQSPATVELDFPVAGACETNLLGAKTADVKRDGSKLHFDVDPWKIRTFEIE